MADLVESFLVRPAEQRLREYKYRCAQSLVFGLPVIALQYFGKGLGGAESSRWIAIFQAALVGWVAYLSSTGMITEGIVLVIAQKKFGLDLLVGMVIAGLTIFSFISVGNVLVGGPIAHFTPVFHVAVMLAILWSAVQWARMALAIAILRSHITAPPASVSASSVGTDGAVDSAPVRRASS